MSSGRTPNFAARPRFASAIVNGGTLAAAGARLRSEQVHGRGRRFEPERPRIDAELL
jgi:hypothetical protein